MELLWFSSRIRFICLVESKGEVSHREYIYVFKAKDFEDAFNVILSVEKVNKKII